MNFEIFIDTRICINSRIKDEMILESDSIALYISDIKENLYIPYKDKYNNQIISGIDLYDDYKNYIKYNEYLFLHKKNKFLNRIKTDFNDVFTYKRNDQNRYYEFNLANQFTTQKINSDTIL